MRSWALLFSLGFIILANSIYLISDWHFSSVINSRNAQYTGKIPHLCLIVLDTIRGDHLSCYGHPFLTSPNLDKVAAEGLLCTNAFSTSNWTPPGHISIFTGKYPSQHGTNGRRHMPDNLLSLAELLNQEGYYSIAIYNNKIAGRNVNITQGFDRDYGVFLNSWVYPAWKRLKDKLILKDQGAKATFSMALATSRWVSRKGGHLFLFLNLFEPHWSYEIHEPFFSDFITPSQKAAIPDLGKVDALRQYRKNIVYDSVKFEQLNEAGYAYHRAAYDSEIAYVDYQFGYYYEGVRDAKLLDQTLLIVTADHGEFLGEHNSLGHPAILFDPVLRIPLMIRYPQMIAPSVIDDYVSNVDIFPTTLSLMGYSELIPDDVEGINILDSREEGNRLILSENLWPTIWIDKDEKIESADFEGACYALRNGSYKLILNSDSLFFKSFPQDTLLLNINADPMEMQDIHSVHQKITDSLALQLNEWVDRIKVYPSDDFDISPEMLETLKALGYIQ